MRKFLLLIILGLGLVYADCSDGDGTSCQVLGDLTGDGLINVVDIVALVNMILADEYSTQADLTQDGLVNVVDIVALVNIIIGKEE